MSASTLRTQRVLLLRNGLVFAEPQAETLPDEMVRAVELQLAELGYVLSTRLRGRLARQTSAGLAGLLKWLYETLTAHLGADQPHRPLFRHFPDGIPRDTERLWVEKVLVHFLQAPHQPCLFCRQVGTTHVLKPCRHVVCDRCFDGSNYSVCPVCEHHVDEASPFFSASELDRASLPLERVTFKLLDLGEELEAAAEAVFRQLCDRQQAMSPADREALDELVQDHGLRVLGWIPPVIPVKETIALLFARLCRQCGPEQVLPAAEPHLQTATDVLRFLAAYSGEDPSLQGQTVYRLAPDGARVSQPIQRFQVAKLSRALRKALLGLLERIPQESLIEDMRRHASYWVWVGEFLHPAEYARRFPNVARAFAVVRKRAPDGTRVSPYRSFASRIETALLNHDEDALLRLLAERPGELARRFDRVLRTLERESGASDRLLALFARRVPQFATPVLLTLYSLLPTRTSRAPVRVYWPKGRVGRGVSGPDERPPLSASAVAAAVELIEGELLRRFAAKPAFDDALVDMALRAITVPFNERTAARSAIALPRGSTLPVPEGRTLRLFLHWCQPPQAAESTDLDLSVAFYGADWRYLGVCSYYQLRFPEGDGPAIATSAGDWRDAPYPDGASEFIDLDRERAAAAGIRYAVMVVNSYVGLPFNQLERAFAGLMLRDDASGAHFDPRTVALKFSLEGENGVFLPWVLDLDDGTLHWLDLYAKGQFAFNNVENSRQDITRICPEMIAYFGSGIRPAMFDLALLHAAARAERVFLRDGDGQTRRLERNGDEPSRFLARLRREAGAPVPVEEAGRGGRSLLAALHTGDLALPESSTRYCLFPAQVSGTIAASDLLS